MKFFFTFYEYARRSLEEIRREWNMKEFRYAYQRYPFDSRQEFTIRALNQDSADEQAQARFAEMCIAEHTTMREFYALA